MISFFSEFFWFFLESHPRVLLIPLLKLCVRFFSRFIWIFEKTPNLNPPVPLAFHKFSVHVLLVTSNMLISIMSLFGFLIAHCGTLCDLISASLPISGDSEETWCPYLQTQFDKNPLTVLLTEIIMVWKVRVWKRNQFFHRNY